MIKTKFEWYLGSDNDILGTSSTGIRLSHITPEMFSNMFGEPREWDDDYIWCLNINNGEIITIYGFDTWLNQGNWKVGSKCISNGTTIIRYLGLIKNMVIENTKLIERRKLQ